MMQMHARALISWHIFSYQDLYICYAQSLWVTSRWQSVLLPIIKLYAICKIVTRQYTKRIAKWFSLRISLSVLEVNRDGSCAVGGSPAATENFLNHTDLGLCWSKVVLIIFISILLPARASISHRLEPNGRHQCFMQWRFTMFLRQV